MALKVQLRRGTAAEWTSANPTLMSGEMGVETDTLKVKIGNGTTAWNLLQYFTQGAQGVQGPAGPQGIQGVKGDVGETGPANTLTVGTVTTGSAGSDAVVTITGSAPNQTISFTIPQGLQGIQGIQGIQGPQGVGVPTGGIEGQIIVKTVDGTAWVDNVVPQVKYTVKNTTGSTIPKGSVVYISGSNGTNILISLADADTEATSSKTVGIVETDIVNNAFGYVVTEGLLAGLNTSGATAGQSVWLSSTAGAFVFGAPPAKPAHSVYLGVVSRVNANNGEIFVKVQNGYELDELHDVQIVSPQDKQVLAYEGGLWKNKSATGGVTVSDPAPSTPIQGDGWFYAADGTLFVRFTDGNGNTTWIQPNAPLAAQVEQRYYSPNYIINGGFDIWQRGTSFSLGVFTADRWWNGNNAGTQTITRSTDVPSGSGVSNSLSLAATSATNPQIYQRVEAANAAQFAGKTITVSFWAKSTAGSAPLSLVALYPTTTADDFSALTADTSVTLSSSPASDWTRYTTTFTASANAVRGYEIILYRASTTANSTTLYAGVQLEIGSTATAFRRNANSLQGELAACQRYYWRITSSPVSGYTVFTNVHGWANGTANAYLSCVPPVPMRAKPSSVEWWHVNMFGIGGTAVSSLGINGVSTGAAILLDAVSTGMTGGYYYGIQGDSTLGAYLGMNAEL